MQHKIDIVIIGETKIEFFSDRALSMLSLTINRWILKPSSGYSGGILVGINTSFFMY